MSQPSKKFNFALWGFILAVVATIAAVLVIPEFRCFIGLKSEVCVVPQQDVELFVQGQTGEALSEVKVRVVAKGPPEILFTDSNGYATVRIASLRNCACISREARLSGSKLYHQFSKRAKHTQNYYTF